MPAQVMIQGTPNPNALKFVLNRPVRHQGNATYKPGDDTSHNPLAAALLSIAGVQEVYFFDNYITVTQDGQADWDTLEDQIQKTILDHIDNHDPDFPYEVTQEAAPPKSDNPEVQKVDAILEQTVRPALQMDGGDIQVIDVKDNVVTIFYQGACGSCPSAAMGTLMAIENLLKNEYNPQVRVEMADSGFMA